MHIQTSPILTHLFRLLSLHPTPGRREAEYASADAFYRKNKASPLQCLHAPMVIDAVRHNAAMAMMNQSLRRAVNSWIDSAASRRETRNKMTAA